MGTIKDSLEAVFRLVRENNVQHYGIGSQKAQEIKENIKAVKDGVVQSGVIPAGWTSDYSIGKGNLAKVMWITFLPPGQKASDGIYVSICFGRDGNGLVTGCAISDTQKDKYRNIVETVNRGKHPVVDVNGVRPGTRYNNGYLNPREFLSGEISEDVFLAHIRGSVEKCEKTLINIAELLAKLHENRPELKKLNPRVNTQSGTEKAVNDKMTVEKHKERKSGKLKMKAGDRDDVLLLRLRAALRTKPFAILAGHSGTGKSRMVRRLAYMYCSDETLCAGPNPGNFCMVQVKPNWHDSTDLLGYYSELGHRYVTTDFVKFICKAYAYPEVPFFVCLDEMNLAPVEQYFAEYLSAIESRKIVDGKVVTDALVSKEAYSERDMTGGAEGVVRYDWLGCEFGESLAWLKQYGLTLPRNLFVVGTVNMDETTNQFSRKVLDRAMTLEMTDADFDHFGEKPLELSYESEYAGKAAVEDLLAGEVLATALTDEQKENLKGLKDVLSSTSFAVAYRFANEYALYEAALESTKACTEIEMGETTADKLPSAFDDMVLMKVLPRISGERELVTEIFRGRGTKETEAAKEGTLLHLLGDNAETSASVAKMKQILKSGGEYLSFWP